MDEHAEPGDVVGKQDSDAGDEYLADEDRPDLVALTEDVVTPRNDDPTVGPVTEPVDDAPRDAEGNLIGTETDAAMYDKTAEPDEG